MNFSAPRHFALSSGRDNPNRQRKIALAFYRQVSKTALYTKQMRDENSCP